MQPLRKNEASGEVSEWLKEHAWKVCIRLKRIAGSNPALSAERIFIEKILFFVYKNPSTYFQNNYAMSYLVLCVLDKCRSYNTDCY